MDIPIPSVWIYDRRNDETALDEYEKVRFERIDGCPLESLAHVSVTDFVC